MPDVLRPLSSTPSVASEPNTASGGAGGAAGELSGPERVRCRLWTEGPASVSVDGEGYPPVLVDLQVDGELCTVIESVELVRGDGGSGS